ncbi:DUF4302 domain-containing protein [Ancylomarina euxinus]|uniref:DUF4302 domain-containing protein n=1 Tax=Ancylomarina euxinus TaxID=2283627 RepID=A0A425Y118_9BACT|nr:DUF4302 domain-containing protein [Ancylomarina euxinus]MCZ4693750.1 DUF4302 domain-containing protein [Ancylomarina euxinus]MUP15170.1 DUF4302 domain-containing protein [Ancylomarina euxinus]RRG21592.1 DUF4302 domain-containing protein [Ancylomarina euxinus]
MKKINLYITSLILLAFTACNNDFESEFDLSPDERASEAVKEFKEVLTSSEYGWLTHYYPNPNKFGGYTYILNFGETGTVSMNWDLYDYPDQAEYSVKMIEEPILIFDTYSKFSKMTDPEIGELGKGYGGELEFSFVRQSADGDTLYLAERVNEDPMVLVKATAETSAQLREYAKHAEHLTRRNESVVPFYFNLSVDGWDSSVNMVFDENRSIAFLSYMLAGESKRELMPVNFTHEGFEFHHPLVLNGIGVRSFKYDASKNQFDITDVDVTGAFKYETIYTAELDGMVTKLFGPKSFDSSGKYISPKLLSLMSGLRIDGASFKSFDVDPYLKSWAPKTFEIFFDDWTAIKFAIDDFEQVSEDIVVIKSTEYVFEWSPPFDNQEGIDAVMNTEKGVAIRALITSVKGWTIVPVEIKEFGTDYYLVSNEDPEMYVFFE